MDIHEEQAGAVTVVTLKGRMDATTSSGVEERLMKIIEGGATRLLLDISQMDYISSVGLRVFILAGKRVKNVNGRMELCGPQPTVRQILQIAGFPTLFKIHETRAAALAG